jgi:hypothetical protein
MKFLVTTYILILGLLLASCTASDNCSEETDVNLKIGFYQHTQNQTTGLYSNTSLIIDSIWVNGFENDSFLYENSKFKNSIVLPLKNSVTQSEFVIRFNDITDTLVVYHENNDQFFISLECGCIVSHSIQAAVSKNHFIDSISIINPEVNNFDAIHIQIFN